MSMKVIILGSGTITPSLERSASAVFTRDGQTNLLIDIGPGVMKRLTEAGVSLTDVSHLFITHFHPDHTGELASFIFANKYGGAYRNKKLTLIGGDGITTFFNNLKTVYGKWIEFDASLFQIVELPMEKFYALSLGNLAINTTPADHNPESLSIKVTDSEGFSFVYSGDTDYNENLVELAMNAHMLISECAMPDDKKIKGHMTPTLAGETARKANVGKLILTHLYPESDESDIVSKAASIFKGTVFKAFDLMQFDF